MNILKKTVGAIFAVGGTVYAICEWTSRGTTSTLVVGLLWLSLAIDGLTTFVSPKTKFKLK